MGLDAFVRCRCWEDGLLRLPPPFPEHVYLDEQEGMLELDLPYAGHEDAFAQFDNWRHACCEHEDMEIVARHISNWGGYGAFKHKLHELGIDRFPTLRDELPEVNGGSMSAARACLALAELDDFMSADFGVRILLVDADSGKEVEEFFDVDHDELASVRHPKARFGTDGRHLFLYDSDRPGAEEIIFQSGCFAQERVGLHEFRLTDEATGHNVLLSTGFGVQQAETVDGKITFVCPARLRIEQVRADAGEFEYIVENLRAVFEASVATGNPVQWT